MIVPKGFMKSALNHQRKICSPSTFFFLGGEVTSNGKGPNLGKIKLNIMVHDTWIIPQTSMSQS